MDESEKPFYIYQLPAKIISELSTALDPGNCWEIIAFFMPGIQGIDIEACRRLGNANDNDGHPTETFLRIWGSKGYNILDLYRVLFRAKLFRCMQILLPFVDKQFHKYAQNCDADQPILPMQQQPSAIERERNPHANTNTNKIHQSLAKRTSMEVYSRKGFSSADPSAGMTAAGIPSSADQSAPTPSTAAFDQNGAILSGLQNTLAVKYEDILTATGGFSSDYILGKGGYGVVYKGMWKHTEVAIKRIQGKKEGGGDRQQKERIRQSLQELRTLAKFRHDNILSLYGYSLDGPEPCLIYQFMSNGSLEDRLFGKNGNQLTWPMKLAVCRGVSCALHFLHSIGTMPIIHGDVKSANILLDKHFEPKLGDFGLSRDGQMEGDRRPMIASHVKGTLAYLPPEFTTCRILTTKLDVYSFGVVLLEVGTGQRAFASSRNPQGLVEFTLKYHAEADDGQESFLKLLPDKSRQDLAENQHIIRSIITLGISCTSEDRFSRPTFSEVFAQLNEVHAGIVGTGGKLQ